MLCFAMLYSKMWKEMNTYVAASQVETHVDIASFRSIQPIQSKSFGVCLCYKGFVVIDLVLSERSAYVTNPDSDFTHVASNELSVKFIAEKKKKINPHFQIAQTVRHVAIELQPGGIA
jgi:hypothetical protein